MQQITLRQLLRDPQYRAWFQKVPTITTVSSAKPWRVLGQREQGGKWGRADMDRYVQAYSAVKLRLPEYYDLTIHSKLQAFKPPVVELGKRRSYMPCPDGHHWCVYCRRPTVFAYFSRHHAMPGMELASYELRCSICAARLSGMRRYKPKFSWDEYRDDV